MKNKNRGVQLVKLYVPFLFQLPTVPYQSPVCLRRGCRANQKLHPCKEKESMEWRNETPCRGFHSLG